MTTKRRPRVERLRKEIHDQRKWIEQCEANGVSYADGERGQKIRQADTNHLKQLESEYEHLTGRRP